MFLVLYFRGFWLQGNALGHTLSVIVIKAELASKLADRDPARAVAELRDVERISREALQEVRGAVRGYRAERLEDEIARGRAALSAAGVTLFAEAVHADVRPEVERALALAVREALTNVIRHARARPGYLRRALEVGAAGYPLKDAPSAQLAEAIRRVVAGGRAIDPSLAAEAWTEADPLTERERQVLRLAGDGLAGEAIAQQLDLSEGTVRNYLSEAIGKLGAKNASKPPASRARKAGSSARARPRTRPCATPAHRS